MKKQGIIAIIIAVAIGGGAIYGVSPYFTESTIDEEFPVVRNTPTGGALDSDQKEALMDLMLEVEEFGDTLEMIETTDDDDAMAVEEMMQDVEAASQRIVSVAEGQSEMMGSDEITEIRDDIDSMARDVESMDVSMRADDRDLTLGMTDDMMSDENMGDNGIVLELMGTFVGVGDGIHDAQGTASVYSVGQDQTILRLEDFRSTNGPALKVYLATDKSASDYVSLGDLKANRGNQNYDIPADVDLEKYDNVLIWCEPFSVLFGSAEIVP